MNNPVTKAVENSLLSLHQQLHQMKETKATTPFFMSRTFFQSNSVGNSTAADRNTVTQMDQNPKGPKN
jgi:hypothetical protein